MLNLLQPQDRRSLAAGDGPEAVAARARLAAAGVDGALIAAVAAWFGELPLAGTPAVLEVGAGVGTQLAALVAARPAEACGLALSAPALDAAARLHPGAATWIVANADRRLPFLDASLDVAVGVKGPKNPPELARVLRPGGRLLLVVPGAEDLAELRRATAGAALPRDPAARALERFGAPFLLRRRVETRERCTLAGELLRDLLRVSYRGLRASEARRAEELGELAVTLHSVLLDLERGPAEDATYSGGSS